MAQHVVCEVRMLYLSGSKHRPAFRQLKPSLTQKSRLPCQANTCGALTTNYNLRDPHYHCRYTRITGISFTWPLCDCGNLVTEPHCQAASEVDFEMLKLTNSCTHTITVRPPCRRERSLCFTGMFLVVDISKFRLHSYLAYRYAQNSAILSKRVRTLIYFVYARWLI